MELLFIEMRRGKEKTLFADAEYLFAHANDVILL